MKKLLLFLYILILLLLPFSSAETLIFSGKVMTDGDKTIDGNIFRFKYDDQSNKVFVQTPTTGLIVENGACSLNSIFKVCINQANFSYRNLTTYESYYEIDVSLYKLTGSLSSNSKSIPNILLPRQSAELTITITNPTDLDMTNIEYTENLSPFSVENVKGCSLDGKRIMWNGSLKSKFDRTCTAKIIAEEDGTYNLIGNLIYFNGFDNEKKLTDALIINVLPRQLNANQIIEQNIEIKHPFYVNMSLQNINKDEKMELTATILLPNNLILLKDIPDFSRDYNILKRSLTLEPGSKYSYSLYLEASSEIESIISQNFDYAIKDVRDAIKNITFIKPIEPKPITDFSAEYTQLTPGQKFIVAAIIKNPSMIYKLTDIKARLTAPYNNEIKESLNNLMPNESYSIISNTLSISKNFNETELGNETIRLNLSIEYNINGVVKSLNKSLEIKLIKESISPATAIESPSIKTENKTQSNKTQSKPITKKENIKSSLFNKKSVYFSALVFGMLCFILVIIIIIRIKKDRDEELKKL